MLKNDKNTEYKYILNIIYKMFPNAGCELIYHNVFELCIATILSAQTTDKSVNKVTPYLFEKYPSPFELANANQFDVLNIIKSIGLSNTKSKNIIAFSKKLVDEYNGVVPCDFEVLQSFPGVGRKTANVVLTEGFKIPRIPVDTHVERVSKRLGLVNDNDSLLKTEETLMSNIDENNWHLAHHLLLFFGRYHCFSRNPNCNNCPLKNKCVYQNKNPLI